MTSVWKTKGLVWLLALSAFGFTASAGEEAYIPVSISDDNRMSVPLSVNGQPAMSVIDTGATFALVDDFLLQLPEEHFPDREVVVQGLSDQALYQVADIDTLEIGSETLRAVPAGIVSTDYFPGHKTIIPASLFPQRVIDFDFQRGAIELHDKRPRTPRRHTASRLKYEEINQLIFVPIRINGKRGRALIDTGSDSSFINSKFVDLAGARDRSDLTQNLIGIDLVKTPVRLVSLKRVKLGDFRMGDFILFSTDPELFSSLGLEDEPVMVIGLNVLRHFRVQIDRKNKEIWFSRND